MPFAPIVAVRVRSPLVGRPLGAAPSYSGSGSPSLSALTVAASASYTVPNYSGSGAVSLSNLTATASASYVNPIYSGSGAVSLSALTVASSASYTTPNYSGSGSPSLSSLTATASASYTAPNISGSGTPTLANLTIASAVASYTAPGAIVGSGGPTLGNLTVNAVAAYTVPSYSGSGAVSLAPLTASAVASYTPPNTSGSGSPTLANLTVTASASYADPASIIGTGAPSLSPLTVASSAAYANPPLSGTGSPRLSNLTVTASASYSSGVVANWRNYDLLTEIVRLLDATQAFSAVRLHGPDEHQEDGADHEIVAYVEEVGWEEDSDADDANSVRERRDVTYRIVLEVKDHNPVRRFQRLSVLAEVCANTLNGVSLLGQTVRPLSRITRANYSEVNHPYRQLHLIGKFTPLYDGYTGHDADGSDIDHIL